MMSVQLFRGQGTVSLKIGILQIIMNKLGYCFNGYMIIQCIPCNLSCGKIVSSVEDTP